MFFYSDHLKDWKWSACADLNTHSILTVLFLWMHRVQGGVLTVWQGWWWYNHYQRARDCDALSGTEPHRGWAAGHDQWGGCWRWGGKVQTCKKIPLVKTFLLPGNNLFFTEILSVLAQALWFKFTVHFLSCLPLYPKLSHWIQFIWHFLPHAKCKNAQKQVT